ncbi:MAG: NAD(P)-dependent oxidoreductase [Thermoproteota archaeon]
MNNSLDVIRNNSYKVLITEPVSLTLTETLEKAGFKVICLKEDMCNQANDLVEDVHALIVRSKTRVDKNLLKKAKKLRIIARAGVGLDNIDVSEALSRGIKVINAPEAPISSVVELTFCLMVMALRKVLHSSLEVKNGLWTKPMGSELNGKTLGIVGFGRVGRRVATVSKAFGMNVVAYDVRDIKREGKILGVKVVKTLPELLKSSDVISLHVPLNSETYHLIGENEISLMKDGAIIVNTSRGAVLDTRALLKALENGKISAAALDVLENEPPKETWEFKLIKLSNVIVTPHIGSQTKEAQERIARIIARKLIRYFNSEV